MASAPIKFSIITVCYNSVATVGDTLRSVAAQTYPDIEHIVIDGASTDGTLREVEKHGARVAKVISEPDKGVYYAMNKGLRVATGEVIGLLNSDDFYATPNVIADVAEAFADPAVDACYGDLLYVKPEDTSAIVRNWRSSSFRPGLFLQGWCPPHPTFFVRRRIYDHFGGFDTQFRIAADIELMARFMEVHRINTRYIPSVFVKMRMGGTTNESWTNVLQQNREIWRAFKMHALKPRLLAFVVGKALSRGKQFLARGA